MTCSDGRCGKGEMDSSVREVDDAMRSLGFNHAEVELRHDSG